jgi:hypothetical protein
MSSTKASKDNTFTPVFDRVLKDTSLLTAAIFGRVWRFCQMEDGVCSASQSRIADGLGISRTAVNEHIKLLVDLGYLKDLDPGRRNHPHRYEDTGKAGASVAEATLELSEVSPKRQSGVAGRTTAVGGNDTKKRKDKRNHNDGDSSQEHEATDTTRADGRPRVLALPSKGVAAVTAAAGDSVFYQGTQEPVICPTCHIGVITVRTRRSDSKKFLGCSRYREGCKWTGEVGQIFHKPREAVVFEDGSASV